MLPDRINRMRWPQAMLVLLGMTLCWPAVVNGYPFLFPDTTSYIRSADAIAFKALGVSTDWTNDDVLHAASMSSMPLSYKTNLKTRKISVKPILLGRSIIYGIIPYVAVILGSIWLAIAMQAIFCGFVLLLLTRHFVDPIERIFPLAFIFLLILTLATPLPYFVSMVMPDVFTGTTVMAAAVILTRWGKETTAGIIGWSLVALTGALTHSSHILILFGMVLFAGFYLIFTSQFKIRPFIMLSVIIGLGLSFEVLFSVGVTKITGVAPIRPPFVTARLVEDGPGKTFLDENCGLRPTFRLCEYRDRLPLPSDEFLWRTDKRGVFKAVSSDEQRVLAIEQTRFVTAVILDHPVMVIISSSRSVLRQLGAMSLREFNVRKAESDDILERLPKISAESFTLTRSYSGTMPVVPVFPIVVVALITIGAMSAAGFLRSVGPLSLIAISGWLVDVLVCGALSTPHDRYQARVIWICLVLAGGNLVFVWKARRLSGVRCKPHTT